MIDRRLKYYAYRVAPRLAAALQRMLRKRAHGSRPAATSAALGFDVVEQARALSREAEGEEDLARVVDIALRYGGVAPNQNRDEILGLLGVLRESKPELLCEIGSAAGGTLFLLSRIAQPNARILSIDLDHNPLRKQSFEALVRPGQQLTCVEGDSHLPAVFDAFRSWIGERKLDFLFIDGDHSLDGVALDHSMYGPYVSPTGAIAFHDIAPDFKTRYGVDTGTDAGGVPSYWAEIKPRHSRCHEFVDHPLQDGRGIGLIAPAASADETAPSC